MRNKRFLASILLSLCFVSHIAFAAISGTAVWEIRSTATGGANVNGGCWNGSGSSPGTDFSQQNGAQYTSSTLTSVGAGDTILWTSAAADMNRNCIRITGGTNFTVGWYEIISVSVGSSIQVDRAVTTGAGVSGVGNVGGAISLGSADDAWFESVTAGNHVYQKGNATYTLGGAVSIASAGTATNPIIFEGYNSARGDNPTGSTRPIMDLGANNFTSGGNWEWGYLQTTTTGTNGFQYATGNKLYYTKHMNTSTTAGRTAVGVSVGTGVSLIAVEAWSIRGFALRGNSTTNSTFVIGGYFHDSDVCYLDGSSTGNTALVGSIISGCVTTGVSFSNTKTGWGMVYGNTIYGSENKNMGTGIDFATGTTNGARVFSNIIYGWTLGANSTDDLTKIAQMVSNDYFNNTTNRTNIPTGSGDIAVSPGFKNVQQVTVTTGTTSNTGNTLTKSGATFITSGVTAGRDFVYISAGGTVGTYTIVTVDSETQISLGQAPGNASGTVTASITVNKNFAVGLGVRNKGFPSIFPAALTTSYPNIGAQQSMPGIPVRTNQ